MREEIVEVMGTDSQARETAVTETEIAIVGSGLSDPPTAAAAPAVT